MQHQQIPFFVLILLLAALAAEYGLYLQLDPVLALEKGERQELLLLKLAAVLGPWCRAGFMLFFLGWITLHPLAVTAPSGRLRHWQGKFLLGRASC
ncbi:hypothetical protein [Cesiribacter andamanensis]|uniref:Uncharacterized protein n=1 Tax=Cesiribacter andamanensis AMV16 TaxID=1279009 RepID=M7N0V9_9BACT|nr:hypothetical protein [Cesiribacter andamanensis]EMR02298.1 hypothetical protein ADICEAN_02570 [Cesiribacter andamanensis AMV16]